VPAILAVTHGGLPLTAVGTASGSHAARLQPGFQLDKYRLGAPLWPLRIADAYKAEGPAGPATIYVIHARIAAHPTVRDAIIAGTRTAAAIPEHKHLVRTLAAGLTGDILWIATEDVDGSLMRDLLLKKRQAGNAGLGTRAAGNLITGVCAALAETHHGALADESIVVNRMGRVRVIDLALGPGTAAAMVAGLLPAQSSVAPEVLAGAVPSGPSDVYAVGALLYEALVGSPLERGGPRPSDVVNGVNTQIDEVVARACHRDPTKRFGRADVLGEVVSEALNKGGAMHTAAVPLLDKAPTLDQQVSLAASLTDGPSPSASGNAVVDRALAVAIADTTEKWLITKGRLDYGPFSLADVVTQIEKGDIVPGNIIMDKDTGARVAVDEHPLLGPMVEQARQHRDDARRAQAEVAVASREKKRGVVLYAMIGAGLLALAAVVVFVIVPALKSDDNQQKGKTVSALEGAKLDVKFTEPKKPPPRRSGGGGGGTRKAGASGGGGGFNNNESMSLDLSDDSDEGSDTLSMGTVYGVYSRYGAQFAGCLGGGGQANIYISINGPSGRVQAVRIDGQTSGPKYNCLARVLRNMQFPPIKGPRTRAEFDISM
jgi:serine/threonine protein kinase